MKHLLVSAAVVLVFLSGELRAAAPPGSATRQRGSEDLARQAQAILQTHCHRCHGKDGAVEGGLNYILDRDKLVARRKLLPGQADKSPLLVRILKGKMPPPGEAPRPNAAEIAVLRRWIDSGATAVSTVAPHRLVSESAVLEWVLADLDRMDRRARRFARYFSLVPLANAGAGEDELKTYRNAVAKLINSLSWHPKIRIPTAVDPLGLVLRIDLRDYLLDANLWNRLLNDYPYGILHDSGIARAVLIATGTRMPIVRADWFVATASRAPLYYDLLQIPSNLAELERQLRVDVATNILQERIVRLGFNGSGISRNNRILERHDAMNGAYWRTYDFEAVPQNLIERNILLPDRRNIFAYPLGPGGAETNFQHAGGEVIFNLPNGLHAYVLINANNIRINKGPTEIVSDPKRPDRAVEAGLSCMNCHARGILPKDDQIREHVRKNRKAFARADVELIEALYPPVKKTRELMEEDSERFRKAVEKTGNKTSAAEVIMAMTLRYEADVDLPTLAAELGVRPADVLPRLAATENLSRNLGALKVSGGTVSRQVVVQSFSDLVRELKLGIALEIGRTGENLPDATGEVDPLEAQSSPANAMAFSPDGKLAAFAANDKSVRIFDIEANRDLRRCIGHTASLWCIAFSPDGTQVISGGKDGTLRVWEVETARELLTINAHVDLVSAVAFSPDGKRALSAGYDHEVILWDLTRGTRVAEFNFTAGARYIHAVAFSPDGKQAVVAGERTLYLIDATGKVLRKLEGHTGWVVHAAFSADGKHIISGSDDGTARLWDVATGKQVRLFTGHTGPVKTTALTRDGRYLLTGGGDTTVRLWDATSAKELRTFRKHADSLVAVAFFPGEKFTLSGSRDGIVEPWNIGKIVPSLGALTQPRSPPPTEEVKDLLQLRPEAIIPVGGTIGRLLLSPDRQWLYYLNLTDSVAGQVNTQTLRRERSLNLAAGTEAIALSPDGKTLVAIMNAKRDRETTLQMIDPVKFTARNYRLALSSHDVAVRDDGLVVLSGGEADWSEVSLVDGREGKAIARWAGVWGKSLLGLTPDGRRLYVSSQGVVPGTLDAFALPASLRSVSQDERPTPQRASDHDKLAVGGAFTISPDGQYLVCRTGTVLKLSARNEDDMRLHTRIEPHLSVAYAEGRFAYVVARDGTLSIYSYPDFRLRWRRRLSLAGYDAVVDGKAGRLYVAGFDPRSVHDRPRAKAHGDIHVYDVKALLAK